MQFSHTTRSRFTPQELFRTYRDHLVEIAPLIGSVQRVERRSRSTLADGSVELVHLWYGTAEAVPVFIRPFVQVEMLRWLDYTRWDAHSLTASWRIELPALGEAVRAAGTYRFEADGDGGRVVAVGDLSLNTAGLPPAMVSAKPLVEKMVVGLLEPMVEDAGGAVVRWLEGRES